MPGTNLTREEAISRAKIISTRHYHVALNLACGPAQFIADTTVHFAATVGASSFIDLIADRVESITLNGAELDPATYFADSRITLPELAAENTLRIVSVMRYMNTGEGLHRFQDPVDGEVYLYSQFEVPDSRRMFAVFEQPDLKATFSFTVVAPARWQVISNQPTPQASSIATTELAAPFDGSTIAAPRDPNPANHALAKWEFQPTPVMSSYITALIAGPYHQVRSELVSSDGRTIPLGVYCRNSLANYLDADYIFDTTRAGFKFFEKEFDYPYPFDKYDQIFAPEYNMGAMENIGAVTFTESYVFRSQVTDATRERRVITILHELAHMWFGDLVTMRWWNDLWLNESFAEYMSTLATAEASEWSDCWTTFAASEKSWAYRQDQLPSTHPIVAPINDLEDVLVNFDGITYAKGASVLKQLVAWVGREPFMRGVHDYFVKHHHGNTELPDLMRELSAQSGRDLSEWTKLWLETAGVNTLTPQFTLAADGSYSSFAIAQSAPATHPTLRPHRIAIGLYDLDAGALTRVHRVELDIAGELSAVPELTGVKAGQLVLINDDDLSYAKIRFDAASLRCVIENLSKITDSLTRALVWGALWDATRDGEMAATQFIDVVLTHLAVETNSTMLRTILQQLSLAQESYVAENKRQLSGEKIAARLWELALSAAAGSDQQFQFVQAFAALACAPAHFDTVQELAAGSTALDGLKIDTDLSWELLIALSAAGRVTPEQIVAKLQSDNTATGQQAAARAQAALPGAANKQAAWDSIILASDKPNAIVRATARGFLQVHDTAVLEPYIKAFFEMLLPVWESRSYHIAEELIEGCYPAPLANAQLRDATASWLAAHEDAPQALRRMISEHLAGIERALNAQAVDSSHSENAA